MDQFAGAQDVWGLREELRLLKDSHYEHADRLSQHSERLARLERRQDDSRIRSLWSTPSPFPAPLSSFTSQPLNNEAHGSFGLFGSQQNLALSGLQLDEIDIPRRGASRANSVRFDDSTTINHWIQDHPSGPGDYFGTRPAGVGDGYAMTERSSSHKSDQRFDGRKNSWRSVRDDTHSPGTENGSFQDAPRKIDGENSFPHSELVPGISSGSAVVRCWLQSPSAYEPLLYAVICTGATRSTIDMSLVVRLDLQDRIEKRSEGERRIKLSMFLPDGIVQPSSKYSGPSKLPHISVDFLILQHNAEPADSHIGVFLGSDTLYDHMGDVLLSQNRVTLNLEDGRKVFIPFCSPTEGNSTDLVTVYVKDLLGELGNHARWNAPSHIASAQNGGQPAFLHPSLSSPRPIQGRQASVIRSVTSMGSPDFPAKDSLPPDVHAERCLSPGHSPMASSGRQDNFRYEQFDRRTPGAQATCSTKQRPLGDDITQTKSDSDGITRGRSHTNPYSALPSSTAGKLCSPTVWDGMKKSSSTGGSAHQSPSTPVQKAPSSRGMKVLRTSKSFTTSVSTSHPTAVASTSGGSSGGDFMGAAKPSQYTAKANTKLGHARAMSGDAGCSNSKGLVRAKSSNVVGGATAFHWMAPKTSTDGG